MLPFHGDDQDTYHFWPSRCIFGYCRRIRKLAGEGISPFMLTNHCFMFRYPRELALYCKELLGF